MITWILLAIYLIGAIIIYEVANMPDFKRGSLFLAITWPLLLVTLLIMFIIFEVYNLISEYKLNKFKKKDE